MNLVNKVKCICLAVVVALACVGCSGQPDVGSDPSDTTETHRPPYEEPVKVVYEDNDHLFDYETVKWDGPADYVIVIPSGNSAARETAELLQDYYKESAGVVLTIVTDKTAASEKEILVGMTNRDESDKDIAEADLNVSVQGKKLVFDGGHDVTVDSAVNKFIRLAPRSGEAVVFKLTTDFVSSLSGDFEGYEYVWGNEFEGLGLDSTDFDSVNQMLGSDIVEISTSKEVVDVNDGRLKMHALSYFNNDKETVKYRIPMTTSCIYHMNYVYGYAEIRARVPYSTGVFPSWWTRSEGKLGERKCYDYMLEIDIYEVFRTYQKTPNLIQWFTEEFDYNSRYEPNLEPGVSRGIATYMVGSNPYVYTMTPSDSLNYEYHIYGFEWTPTEMKMYVDGTCHVVYDITKNEYTKHPDMTGFHDPQYFNFNTHLFHETVSTACKSIETSPESLPGHHYIDYIRLYQKPGQGKLYTAD